MSVVSRVSDARLQRAVARFSTAESVGGHFIYEEFGRTKNVSTQRTLAVFGSLYSSIWCFEELYYVGLQSARMECQAVFCWYYLFWANGQRVAYKMTTRVRLFVLTCRNVFSLLVIQAKSGCLLLLLLFLVRFFARLLDQRGKGKR